MNIEKAVSEAFKAVIGRDPCEGGVSTYNPGTLDQVVMDVAAEHCVDRADLLNTGYKGNGIAAVRVECIKRMREECEGASISNMSEAMCATEGAVIRWLRKARKSC